MWTERATKIAVLKLIPVIHYALIHIPFFFNLLLISGHHLTELKAMLRRELKVWSSGLCLDGNKISAGGSGSLSDNSSRDSVANETSAASRTDKLALEQRDKKYSLNNNGPEVEISRCCVVL